MAIFDFIKGGSKKGATGQKGMPPGNSYGQNAPAPPGAGSVRTGAQSQIASQYSGSAYPGAPTPQYGQGGMQNPAQGAQSPGVLLANFAHALSKAAPPADFASKSKSSPNSIHQAMTHFGQIALATSDSIMPDGSQASVLTGFWALQSDGALTPAPDAAVAELLENIDFSSSLSAAFEERKHAIFTRMVKTPLQQGDMLLYQSDPQRARTFLFEIGDGREIVVFSNERKNELHRAALVTRGALGTKSISPLPSDLYEPLYDHDSISSALGSMASEKPFDGAAMPSYQVGPSARIPSSAQMPSQPTYKFQPGPSAQKTPAPPAYPKAGAQPSMQKAPAMQTPSAKKIPEPSTYSPIRKQATAAEITSMHDDDSGGDDDGGTGEGVIPDHVPELYDNEVDLESKFYDEGWHEKALSSDNLKGARQKIENLASRVGKKGASAKEAPFASVPRAKAPSAPKPQLQMPKQKMQKASTTPVQPAKMQKQNAPGQNLPEGDLQFHDGPLKFFQGGEQGEFPEPLHPHTLSIKGLDPYQAQKKILQAIDELHRQRMESDGALKVEVKRLDARLKSYEKTIKEFSSQLGEFRQAYQKRRAAAEASLRSFDKVASQAEMFNSRVDELTAAAGELHEQVSAIKLPEKKDEEWEARLGESLSSLKEVSNLLAEAERRHNAQLEKMSAKLQQSLDKSISKARK